MELRELRQHGEVRNWIAPALKVFDKAKAGGFELPADLVASGEHFQQVQGAIRDLLAAFPPEPAQAAMQLAGGVAGGQVPADLGRKLLKAETAYEEARAALQVLRIVERRAAGELTNAFDDAAEEIVTEHLRPTLDKLLADATKAAPKLQGARDAAALVALQDQAALKAWSDLGLLHSRYVAIREAYDRVFDAAFQGELGVSASDIGGVVRFRNWFELPKTPDGAPQVPSEHAAFVVWLVQGDSGVTPEPWLPLPEEIEPVLEQARVRVRDEQIAGFQRVRARTTAAQRREAREQEAREAVHVTPWGPKEGE